MNNLITTTNTISNLNISLNFGELYFLNGEEFSFSYENIIEEDFEIKEENRCLSIKDNRKGNVRLFGKKQDYSPIIRITVPTTHTFESITLSSGASEIHANSLSTQNISLKMGAGEFHIGELNASDHASIESGAGEVHVGTGRIHNLDISSGAGEIHVQAELTGTSYISAGVGEIHLQLLGNPDDYSATISKGLGRTCVSGFSSGNGMTYGSGPNHIKISSGVGEIQLDFAEIENRC